MTRIIAAFLMLIGLIIAASEARAGIPKNALGAVAVSPDGRTVLAAGDNRVLYVLDAGSMTVQKRIWIGINPLAIHFSANGSAFALHDTKGALRFYDAASYRMNSEVTGVEAVAVAEKADLIFTAGRPRGRDANVKTPLRAYALATGKPVLDKAVKMAILGLGVDSDARRIFAMSKFFKTDAEMVQKPPSNLAGVARETFRQRHDGRAAQLVAFDVNGTELGRHTSWFSSSRKVRMIPRGNILRVISFHNYNAMFTLGTMETSLFQGKSSYNFGIGYSVENNALVSGGLAKGTIMHLDSGKQNSFSLSRIGGWPEYFKSFAVARDGTVFGGTTAYRLVRITPDGAVKTVPVF